MSSVTKKTIENPEVPGLECLLPPPPPPPPLSNATSTGVKKQNVAPIVEVPENLNDAGGVIEKSAELKIDLADAEGGETVGSATGAKNSSENVARPFALAGLPVFPETMQRPYFVQTAVEQVPGVEQPWWIPTESDTNDFVPQTAPWMERGAAWTDPSQKNISPNAKAKAKFFKRKSECIDPAQDAERVANAQRELSALMKPLKCDLCNAIMNSTLQAKLHYEGKPHQKKVSMFLNQSVKKIKPDDGQVTSTTSNTDWNTYCEVCKTWFTSQIDASQHYAGKKHIRATTGATKQKTKKPQAVSAPIDPTGRFGIGVPFSAPGSGPILEDGEIPSIPPVVSPIIAPVVAPVGNYQNPTWPFPTFPCELCGVTANRPEQLETHKRGARHLRMMKMSGLASPEVEEIKEIPAQPVPTIIDYSIHRTPSGQYYCAPCNRSFHSENSFAQHIDSKKHKTQINPKQPVSPIVISKKPSKSSK